MAYGEMPYFLNEEVKVLGLINKHKVENHKTYKKMEREKIILKISENHKSFIDYVSNLSKDELNLVRTINGLLVNN